MPTEFVTPDPHTAPSAPIPQDGESQPGNASSCPAPPPEAPGKRTPEGKSKHKLSKRTWVSLFFIVVLIPVVLVVLGSRMQTMKWDFSLFGTTVVWRLHYAVSLLIIICTMIPFFMVFEKRKPQARELVVIATLAALAVAGRAAFFMLPQFKPVCAIVIIAGVCFGAESGFLVGAVTGFVSNFFFGQGIYTPWQMFCFGIVGFLAGILFKKGLLPKKRIPLCIYGTLATFLIYGGIINLGTLLSSGNPLTWPAVIATYASALPFDLVHAAATAFFLLLFSKPVIEILDRIKVKYGMLEP